MRVRMLRQPGNESLVGRRTTSRPGVSFALASMLLAGCSAANTGTESTAANGAPGPGAVDVLYGTLNYDGLTADGLCLFGGARPCFAPIRTEPRFMPEGQNPTGNYMNPGEFTLDAEGSRQYISISWPYEAGEGKPADELAVLCRVEGPEVHGVDASIGSTVWDAVRIPSDISVSGNDEVGYAPERWLRLPPNFIIDACSQAANPAGSPLALTPTR
jgi:hypothetical protein